MLLVQRCYRERCQVISGNRPWLWVFLIDFLGDLMTTRWVPSSFIIFKWSSIWLQNSHQNHAGGYISIQAKGKHVYVISGWTSTRKRTPHTFRKSAFRFARLSILHLKDTGDPFEGEHLLHLKSTAVEQKVCFYFCVHPFIDLKNGWFLRSMQIPQVSVWFLLCVLSWPRPGGCQDRTGLYPARSPGSWKTKRISSSASPAAEQTDSNQKDVG